MPQKSKKITKTQKAAPDLPDVQYHVANRILHVVYAAQPPRWLQDLATEYEGDISYRVGINFPLKPAHTSLSCLKCLRVHGEFEYVIGYVASDPFMQRHEQLHADFYLDARYRQQVERQWNKMNPIEREKIEKRLASLGYPPHVYMDEWQAYVGSGEWGNGHTKK